MMKVMTVNEGINVLLAGGDLSGTVIDQEEAKRYGEHSVRVVDNAFLFLDDVDALSNHDVLSNIWYISDEYADMDIETYILNKCSTDEELDRVKLELTLFKERELLPLLRQLHYVVNYLRDNNIIWGIGRGSSVSSYVLYLLEVHRVDSIKYDLDITEFLK
jgi:DNA polymerase III alpha subunit